MTTTPENTDAVAARNALHAVRAEVAKVVVGQDAAVSALLVALLAGGHVLMEGVPGVAKTLLVRSLAASLGVSTRRVQFTPDLMPGDITGSMVVDGGRFDFRPGPVFTNLLLADEINRTPPKTQSALLEAMEENQVSVDGEFLMKVVLPVPPREEELAIVRRHADGFDPHDLAATGISAVAGPSELAVASRAVAGVRVGDEVAAYVVDIARATRVSPSLSLGVSPRGATALLRTSRAWAWLSGRDFVSPDDVKALAHATLVHRLGLRPEASLEGVDVAQVLASAIASVPVPR